MLFLEVVLTLCVSKASFFTWFILYIRRIPLAGYGAGEVGVLAPCQFR